MGNTDNLFFGLQASGEMLRRAPEPRALLTPAITLLTRAVTLLPPSFPSPALPPTSECPLGPLAGTQALQLAQVATENNSKESHPCRKATKVTSLGAA